MTRNAGVDAMILAYIMMLKSRPRVPAWRTPVGEKRTRVQAKKRKTKRRGARKARRGKRK